MKKGIICFLVICILLSMGCFSLRPAPVAQDYGSDSAALHNDGSHNVALSNCSPTNAALSDYSLNCAAPAYRLPYNTALDDNSLDGAAPSVYSPRNAALAYRSQDSAAPSVYSPLNTAPPDYGPHNLIRFHVIANSDREEDQLLKYAVRDAILKELAPKLAAAKSAAESREIVLGLEEKLLAIVRGVIEDWRLDYPVTLEYGVFAFPAKSYGNLVLPGGDYEAVEIKIGQAQGANWWCILFPPICFVNAEEATSLPVDGKKAVPMDTARKSMIKKNDSRAGKKQIGFFFERFLK